MLTPISIGLIFVLSLSRAMRLTAEFRWLTLEKNSPAESFLHHHGEEL